MIKNIFFKLVKSPSFRIMLITGLGMAFMLLLDMSIVFKFGSNLTTDALVIALTFPLFLDTVFRESARFTLIPYLKKQEKVLEGKYHEFFYRLLISSLLLGVILFLFALIFSSIIISLIGFGLNEKYQALATAGLVFSSLIILLAPITNVLTVHFNLKGIFWLVASRNLVRGVMGILCVIIFWASNDFIYIYTLSFSIGALAYVILLSTYFLRKNSFLMKLSLLKKEEVKNILTNLSYPFYGFFTRQASRICEKSIATLLVPGGVTFYFISFRIVSAIQTIIGLSIATVSIEFFTKNLNNMKSFFGRLRNVNKKVFIFTSIVSILLFISLKVPFVLELLTKYRLDTDLFVPSFSYLLIGLVFLCLLPTLDASLYALGKNRIIFMNMLIVSIFNVVTAYSLGISLGIEGIAIATSSAAILGVILSSFQIIKFKRKNGLN